MKMDSLRLCVFAFKFLCVCLLLLGTSCQKEPASLYIYTWSETFDPVLIDAFEKEFDCRVTIESYDSNEAMYAKLKAIGSGYDIINPSSYYVTILEGQGMLDPIDAALIPNIEFIDREMLEILGDDLPIRSSVPYVLSYVAIGYRKDKLAQAPTSWNIFADSSYKGRMTMLDDNREVLGAALLYLNDDPNTVDNVKIEKATEQVIAWKKNLAKFDSLQPRQGIADAEFFVVQMYSKDLIQVMKEEPRVGLAQPQEGSTYSSDHLAIPKGAPHRELAHAFINFLHRPENAVINMRYTGYTCPNRAAYELLEDEIKNNTAYFPPQEFLKKSFLIKDLGTSLKLYHAAWNEIKGS